MNLDPKDLDDYRIQRLPDEVFYIPNFISESEEEKLLRKVYDTSSTKWVQLSNRRLQNWGGIPHVKGMLSENIPQWLKDHFPRLLDLNVFHGNSPNHVLVNEYKPGQGIMAHSDGPLYYPSVAIISLASSCLMDFYEKINPEEGQNHLVEMDSDRRVQTNGKHYAQVKVEQSNPVDGDDFYDTKNDNIILNDNNEFVLPSNHGSNSYGGSDASDNLGTSQTPTSPSSKAATFMPTDILHARKTKTFNERLIGSLFLDRRSLLVFRGEMYDKYLHGISDRQEDSISEKVVNVAAGNCLVERGITRVSLTVRLVPKVLKANRFFGKKKKVPTATLR